MSAVPKVVTGLLHRVRRGRAHSFAVETPPEPVRQPARVAVMLALAHKIRQAIDRGEIKDQAEAARMLGLTRARITQMIDLTFLSPSVQEDLLFLEAGIAAEPETERGLRRLVNVASWANQATVRAADARSDARP